MSNNIRLNRLELKNYRCFADFSIDFDPELTVLVARNGGGKTAILDAVAVALGPFVKALGISPGGGVIRPEDARLIQNPARALKEMEPQYPVGVKATGLVEDQVFDWTRTRASEASHTKYAEDWVIRDYAQDLRRKVQAHEPVTLPVVAYYGTGRLWGRRQQSRDRKKSTSTSRLRGYKDCLDPSSSYRDFEAWYEKLHLVILEEREARTQAFEEAQAQLRAVSFAVNKGLEPTNWGHLRYRQAVEGIIASHPVHGDLAVDLLSDGVRNMIGLIADIAYRMASLNSHLQLEAVKGTPGIVLIDEVDMHLHPEWQQVVLKSLRDAFPRVQFIVTTHSPQVLSTVHRGNIRILEEQHGQLVAAEPVQSPYARESRVALEDVMSVPSRPRVGPAEDLERYHRLIENGESESPDAVTLRHRLEEQFGRGSEELQLADLAIARWKALYRGRGGDV